MKPLLLLFAGVFMAISALPYPSTAQSTPTVENLDQSLKSSAETVSPVSEDQVRAIKDLLVTLESKTGRAEFIAELKAIISAAEAANAQSETQDRANDTSGEDESVTQSVSELLQIDETASEAIDSYESWLSQFGIQDNVAKKYSMAAVVGLALSLTFYLIAFVAKKVKQRLHNTSKIDHYRLRRIDGYIWTVNALFYFGATVGFTFLFVLTLDWDLQKYSFIPSASYLFGVGGGITILFVLGAFLYELLYAGLERISENGSGRLRTIAPLVRNIVMLTMFVLGGLTILSELGINVMPLLAGAGVVGIAIGFGAQTLFKDLITGFIVIIEDLFQIGDWVAVGGSEGTVENITFRKIDLRDLSGTVHTIPFGSIDTVKNYMKGFSFAVLNVEIAYREDTDAVSEELLAIDQDIREDENFSNLITDEMEIMGVDSLGDSSVAIKVRIKTIAGEQWGVAREYRRRIKYRFDEAGIEIPFPHQTLYFGESKTGISPPARVSLVEQADADTETKKTDKGNREPSETDDEASTSTNTKDKDSRKRGGTLASSDSDGDSD